MSRASRAQRPQRVGRCGECRGLAISWHGEPAKLVHEPGCSVPDDLAPNLPPGWTGRTQTSRSGKRWGYWIQRSGGAMFVSPHRFGSRAAAKRAALADAHGSEELSKYDDTGRVRAGFSADPSKGECEVYGATGDQPHTDEDCFK